MSVKKQTATNRLQRTMPTQNQITADLKVKNTVVFIDERVVDHACVSVWLKAFTKVVRVRSGESLKTLEEYARCVRLLLPHLDGYLPQESALVVVGGGTIGDLGGFLASTLKRGIKLCHIPSTWLSAMDSAHGGKTGVNVDRLKNQVGTFYPAQKVYLVQELLFTQPKDNLRSGLGEAIKMAIIDGGSLFTHFEKCQNADENFLWKCLPQLIRAKDKIVRKDPKEQKGIRRILNLGHTLGHVIEAEMLVPHGVAVQMGTEFSLDWSVDLKLLNKNKREKIRRVMQKNILTPVAPLKADVVSLRVGQDKKNSHSGLQFVFVKDVGRALVREVSVADFIQAATVRGWVRS